MHFISFVVKSAIPTARSSLERVRTKLSVVTRFLPRLKVKPRELPALSENEESDCNTMAGDELAITRVAAAQGSFQHNETEQNRAEKRDEKLGSRERQIGIVEPDEPRSASKALALPLQQIICNSCITKDSEEPRKKNAEQTNDVLNSSEPVSQPVKNKRKLTTAKEFRIRMVSG